MAVEARESLEASLTLAQLRRDGGERERRPKYRSGARQAESKRQPAAQVDDGLRGRELSDHAVPANSADEELDTLGLRQQPERNEAGVLSHEQAVQAIATGDEGQAAGGPRQERADLLGVERVVKHKQEPAAGEKA